MRNTHILLAAGLAMTPAALAQDVAVSKVAGGSDYAYYGTSAGKVAYSLATTSCNVGNVLINWTPSNHQAPAISTTMFRIYDSRIEMLGYAWLKDSFCAVSEPSCGNCQATPCSTLGIGCADTYGSGLNDGAQGVSRFNLNPTTGTWPANWVTASGALPLRGRIQFPTTEAADSNSIYISEAQYISEHDQLAGNARNNASWQEFRFVNGSLSNLANVGSIHMFDPAIFAWQNEYPDVYIDELVNTDEGGAGVHGYVFVASKATDLGGGNWRYDYAIQNFNSKQAVGSFTLPALPGPLSNVNFRDVDHHSGSPWDNTDWGYSNAGGAPAWTVTETYAQNVNANAIRWGFLYNFSFEVAAPPAPAYASATLGLFEPGTNNSLQADVIIPDGNACLGGSISSYCTANANSVSANGADLQITGTPNVAANDLEFLVTGLPANQFGYFLMAPNQGNSTLGGGSQGNLCLGAGIVRWNETQYILNSGLFGYVSLTPDLNNGPYGYVFGPGETWNFQYWYRDLNPGSTSNTTAGVQVQFCQ